MSTKEKILILLMALACGAWIFQAPSIPIKASEFSREEIRVPLWHVDQDFQADVQSIDLVIKALYESLTFPEGKGPDWERFKNLFASPTTPFIRITPEGVIVMDREGFGSSFGDRIKKGTLKSFYEAEIYRRAETYGGIAQAFSTYEKGLNTIDPQKFTRGINSLQLFFKDGRWWISSLMWEDESKGNPIPSKYLK